MRMKISPVPVAAMTTRITTARPGAEHQVADVTTVRIVDERFEPNNILIETGQTVTWENQDDDQHTASGRGMDTGVINPGSKGTVTFLDPGDFQLHRATSIPRCLAWSRSQAIEGDARRQVRKPAQSRRRWRLRSRSSICIRSREGDTRPLAAR